MVSSDEETELADEGEECLRALLAAFLFFLDFLDFLEDFFLSFAARLFLKSAGLVLELRLPGVGLWDLTERDGGPEDKVEPDAGGKEFVTRSGKIGVASPSSSSESVCFP